MTAGDNLKSSWPQSNNRYACSPPRRRIDGKIIDKPLGPAQSQTHAAAGAKSVFERLLHVRHSRSLIGKSHTQAAPVDVIKGLELDLAPTPMFKHITRQLARRRD